MSPVCSNLQVLATQPVQLRAFATCLGELTEFWTGQANHILCQVLESLSQAIKLSLCVLNRYSLVKLSHVF